MTDSSKLRVAVAQCQIGTDPELNLATCLRMLDEAAQCQPDIVLLPEFCNYLSWYDDKRHCFDVSVTLEGDFLKAITSKAVELGFYVVVNCTIQREDGTATGSSLLYSPEGVLLADNTKQIYIGHENDFLAKASSEGPIIDSPWGKLGLYACMDGVINETARGLALRGADLILNSLNSFASDESSLHIPVRAAENKIFVAAANKVGPLVPEGMVAGISAATGIPERFLNGAGESQIVAPDGTVLAQASLDKEEVVYADIDLADAGNKKRPDGTDVFASRRPALYRPISEDPAGQPLPLMSGRQSLKAANLQLAEAFNLDEACELVALGAAAGNELLAIAPLFDGGDPQALEQQSEKIVAALSALCADSFVATALVRVVGDGHQYGAALIGKAGVELFQPQIHRSERNCWSVLDDTVNTVQLPFARVGLVCSDDSIYPETFRLLAMAGVEVAAVPLTPLETWELATGLLERSAENRINLLVATQPGPLGTSFATALQTDFTVLTEWKERAFDGLLSQPIWLKAEAGPGVYSAQLYPANAANKVVSRNTDLLADRPWQLAGAISAE